MTGRTNYVGEMKLNFKIRLIMIAIIRQRVIRDSKSSAAAVADNTTHARKRHRTVNTGCGGGGYSTFGGDDGACATGRRRT